MGVVYQINFPDGRFYIGHTICALKSRLSGHVCDPSSNEMAQIIEEGKYNTGDLRNMTCIIYDDWDSSFHELALIFKHKDNPDIINKIMRVSKPSYNEWFDREINKPVYINTRGLYLKYMDCLESSGRTKDNFLNNLLDLYLANTGQAFPAYANNYKAMNKENK